MNQVCIEVTGERALFADPIISAGGEKISYEVPVYEALKGLLKNIYWKPTFLWVIDKVRVMNPIMMESVGIKLPRYNDSSSDLSYYTYLVNVKYQILAHMEWNINRPEYNNDRDQGKHFTIFKDSVAKGGRYPIFLGKSECKADVSMTHFGNGEGFYDHAGKYYLGFMYHGLTYADEAYNDVTKDSLSLRFSNLEMVDGVIKYPRPEACVTRKIRKDEIKRWVEEGGE